MEGRISPHNLSGRGGYTSCGYTIYPIAFNSTAINFRIAKFRHSNLGPKCALKMGPKFALADIFQNNMGREYLLMNQSPTNELKSKVCTLGYVPSPKFFFKSEVNDSEFIGG
jgi:hypothetical protein